MRVASKPPSGEEHLDDDREGQHFQHLHPITPAAQTPLKTRIVVTPSVEHCAMAQEQALRDGPA